MSDCAELPTITKETTKPEARRFVAAFDRHFPDAIGLAERSYDTWRKSGFHAVMIGGLFCGSLVAMVALMTGEPGLLIGLPIVGAVGVAAHGILPYVARRRFYTQCSSRGVTPAQFEQLDMAMRLAGYTSRESAGGLSWYDAPFRRPPRKGEGGCGGAGCGGGGCGG